MKWVAVERGVVAGRIVWFLENPVLGSRLIHNQHLGEWGIHLRGGYAGLRA